jgi:hypothetical protein
MMTSADGCITSQLLDEWVGFFVMKSGYRLRFIINANGDILLVDMVGGPFSQQDTHSVNTCSSCNSRSGDRSSDSCVGGCHQHIRPVGLPIWSGINLPVISAAAAADILEEQLWSEPFGREDAAKLLEIGCTVQV